MTKPYDEDTVLTDYVCNHYGHLFSKQEALVANWLLHRAKLRSLRQGCLSSRVLEERRLQIERLLDPKVREEVASNPQAFRTRVRKRILRERANEVNLNRCPRCGRVPRTPLARRCRWCFHSWYEGG